MMLRAPMPGFASRVAAAAAFAAAFAGAGGADDWPQFRGGPRLGVVPAARVPLGWSDSDHLGWRTAIPGAGWSQPIVSGGRIFLTTAVGPAADTPSGMGGVMSFSTWGWGSAPTLPVQWRVLCLDPADGRIAWSRTIAEAVPTYGKHASNTFATETPCASADTVFAFFGATGTLVALDREGTQRWRREFGPQPIQNQFGTGSSPLLARDEAAGERLILQLYNDESARLHCLDTRSGADVWIAERGRGTAWSTPVAWTNDGTAEIVTAGQGSVIAYALTDGKERWRLGGIDTSFACSLAADAEGVYVGTSSPGSRAPLYCVARGHAGDLTPPKVQTATAAVPWSRFKSGAGMPSPVVADGLLYFFGDRAVCYDARTGTEKYRKRLPGGTTCVGCPLVIGTRIYVVNEKGKTVVLQAGPEFKVLAESSLGRDGEIFWATPAVCGDALLIRSSAAVYCIR